MIMGFHIMILIFPVVSAAFVNFFKFCLIRPSQTAAFPTFAANRKEVLNLSSQEDLVPN